MTPPDKPFSSGWRDLSYVPRWVILRRNRHQFLAEHSYFVAVYADQIARLINWKGDYAQLFRFALYHDVEETITGDIPGPTKRIAWNVERANEGIKPVVQRKFGDDVVDCIYNVDKEIKALVSFADSVEEVSYLMEERLSGNVVWVSSVLEESILRMRTKWWRLPTDPLTLIEKEPLLDKIVEMQNDLPELMKDVILNGV